MLGYDARQFTRFATRYAAFAHAHARFSPPLRSLPFFFAPCCLFDIASPMPRLLVACAGAACFQSLSIIDSAPHCRILLRYAIPVMPLMPPFMPRRRCEIHLLRVTACRHSRPARDRNARKEGRCITPTVTACRYAAATPLCRCLAIRASVTLPRLRLRHADAAAIICCFAAKICHAMYMLLLPCHFRYMLPLRYYAAIIDMPLLIRQLP